MQSLSVQDRTGVSQGAEKPIGSNPLTPFVAGLQGARRKTRSKRINEFRDAHMSSGMEAGMREAADRLEQIADA